MAEEEPEAAPVVPEISGRDNKGRFALGNQATPKGRNNNPVYRQQRELRLLLIEIVTPERLAAIVEELVRKAEEGNVFCAKEVLDRTLGKARMAPDPEGDVIKAEDAKEMLHEIHAVIAEYDQGAAQHMIEALQSRPKGKAMQAIGEHLVRMGDV